MTRPIILLLVALAALSCRNGDAPEPAAPEAPVEPVEEAEPGDPIAPPMGEYTCRITLGEEEETESTCAIVEGDLPDSLWLETREGDILISGEVTPVDADSFELAGDVYCPQGSCDEELDATFERSATGAYEARTRTSEGELVIELTRR